MNRITKRPGALRDISRHAAYFEEYANLATAERFLDAAEAAFALLASMPYMGRQRECRLIVFQHCANGPSEALKTI